MAMDCAQFRALVHDLERTGTDGFARRVEALAHAENCASCNGLLEEVTLLDFALDAIAVEDRDQQASPRVEATVVAEFRRQSGVAARPRRSYPLMTAALGVAAAVMLALGLAASHRVTARRGLSVGPSAGRAAVAGTPASDPARNSRQADSSLSEQSGAISSDDSEYATNFVALPYADDPGTLDGGTVVRVTLSRDALASLGVPVADLNPNEPVPADIALSVDGVPQAIRLLADENEDHTN